MQLSGLGAALKEAMTALVPRSIAIPIAVAEVRAVLLGCQAGSAGRDQL